MLVDARKSCSLLGKVFASLFQCKHCSGVLFSAVFYVRGLHLCKYQRGLIGATRDKLGKFCSFSCWKEMSCCRHSCKALKGREDLWMRSPWQGGWVTIWRGKLVLSPAVINVILTSYPYILLQGRCTMSLLDVTQKCDKKLDIQLIFAVLLQCPKKKGMSSFQLASRTVPLLTAWCAYLNNENSYLWALNSFACWFTCC